MNKNQTGETMYTSQGVCRWFVKWNINSTAKQNHLEMKMFN